MSNTNAAAANLQATDLPSLAQQTTAAACIGITWYLCAELNVRLLLCCTRRSLYFWACFLCVKAIAIHTLFILLNNFRIWKSYGATVIIEITWWTFVVSQSVVLYSRLDLVLKNKLLGRYVLWMILFTTTVVGLTTVIFGLIARYPIKGDRHETPNSIIDKIQLAVFFVQETMIGLLYIQATTSYLRNRTSLGADRKITRRVLHHLIYVNAFIICLDCSLVGLRYPGAPYFFLQGFNKTAIYAVKLRTGFTILNQLRSTLPGGSDYGAEYVGAHANAAQPRPPMVNYRASMHPSQDSDVEMVPRADQIRVQKHRVVSTSKRATQDRHTET